MGSLSRDAQIDASLRKYLTQVWRSPLLEEAEESALSLRWHEHRDRSALDALVESHLRLVAKIAMGYRGYGLPLADLISEGTVGLMEAAKRFHPHRGARLNTYARWWIRAKIHAYVLNSWSLVKIATTSAQRKLFFRLRTLKRDIQASAFGDMEREDVQRIARELGVLASDVVSMNRRMTGGDVSLDTPGDSVEEMDGWMDHLVDESVNQEGDLAQKQNTGHRMKLLADAVDSLSCRERRIFRERRLSEEPLTLEQLSAEYGISPARVRQIEIAAMAKVEKAVMAHARQANGRSRTGERPCFMGQSTSPASRREPESTLPGVFPVTAPRAHHGSQPRVAPLNLHDLAMAG